MPQLLSVAQENPGDLLASTIAPVDLGRFPPLGLGSFVVVEIPLGKGHDLAAVDVGALDDVLVGIRMPFGDGPFGRLLLRLGRVSTGKEGLVVGFIVEGRELNLHQLGHVGLDGLFNSDPHVLCWR